MHWIAVEDLYRSDKSYQLTPQRRVHMYSLLASLLSEAPSLARYLAELQQRIQSTPQPSGGAASTSVAFGLGAGAGGALFGAAAAQPSITTYACRARRWFRSRLNTSHARRSTFESVAMQFGKQFYDSIGANNAALAPFFTADSMFTLAGQGFMGAAQILAALQVRRNATPFFALADCAVCFDRMFRRSDRRRWKRSRCRNRTACCSSCTARWRFARALTKKKAIRWRFTLSRARTERRWQVQSGVYADAVGRVVRRAQHDSPRRLKTQSEAESPRSDKT